MAKLPSAVPIAIYDVYVTGVVHIFHPREQCETDVSCLNLSYVPKTCKYIWYLLYSYFQVEI
jgi:hypothetical protein